MCSVQKKGNCGVPWRSSGTLKAATGDQALTRCLTQLQGKKERSDEAKEGEAAFRDRTCRSMDIWSSRYWHCGTQTEPQLSSEREAGW